MGTSEDAQPMKYEPEKGYYTTTILMSRVLYYAEKTKVDSIQMKQKK